MYATGDWTRPKDPTKAVYWYRLAAERGHHDAQYNLGFMYILGEGVTADVAEGLLWLHRSADQGNRSAMRLLADLYRNGHYGVPIEAENGRPLG
jgi:TPR repeat protein